MDEKQRIEKIMEAVQLNSGQFAIQIGIQNSTLSHILNNRNKPSLEVLKKILQRFPSISSDWLILGQGAMFRQEFKSQERSLFDQIDENASLSDSLIRNVEKNSFSEKESDNFSLLKTEEPAVYSRKNSLNQENRPPVLENAEIGLSPKEKTEGFRDAEQELASIASHQNSKKVSKIILYFTDNTFQEFESK